MAKVGLISLGCDKNRVDAEAMLGQLAQHGHEITDEPAAADVIIVNTCGFIDAAKEESILTILEMAGYKSGGAKLIVTGCLGQRYGRELTGEIPEIDAVVGTGSWHRITEAVDAVLAGQKLLWTAEQGAPVAAARLLTTPSYTAYVKIAEGCDHHCTYCVIPSLRGGLRSRPIADVVAEVRRLAQQGVKEVNLVAQDVTSYGRDRQGSPMLAELLAALDEIEELVWIRLLYCYPHYFTDQLLEVIARGRHICHYIDLPLQHGNDEILRRMGRPDSMADIKKLLRKIRARIPDVALRTSFIVGFPGETAEHFQTLLDFVQEARFDRVGVFTYSQEEGTPAATMPGQVPEEVKQERYHTLMSLQCRISEEINQSLVGQTLRVLVEGEQDGVAYGRSYRDAPDVDGRVYIEGVRATPGQFVTVRVAEGYTYDLLCTPQEEG